MYSLIRDVELRSMLESMYLDVDSQFSPNPWRGTVGTDMRSLKIAERQLEVDEFGEFSKWQERDIQALVRGFSEMMNELGYMKFIAVPEVYSSGVSGNNFSQWLKWVNPTLHCDYVAFMATLGVDKNFNGGIRFSIAELNSFLNAAVQFSFDYFNLTLDDGSKVVSDMDIYLVCENKSAVFQLWHHSAILAYLKDYPLYVQLRDSIPRHGLYSV